MRDYTFESNTIRKETQHGSVSFSGVHGRGNGAENVRYSRPKKGARLTSRKEGFRTQRGAAHKLIYEERSL